MSSTLILPRFNDNNINMNANTQHDIRLGMRSLCKIPDHTCDWKFDHQGHEQGAINLIYKYTDSLLLFSWQPLYPIQLKWSGVNVIFASNQLCVPCLFLYQSETFCIWTSTHGLLQGGIWQLFLFHGYLNWGLLHQWISQFGTCCFWFGSPIGAEQWQLMFETNFCAFCNVKPESANQRGRRSSYDPFIYITLKHSHWMKITT